MTTDDSAARMTIRHVEARTHGRYVVRVPDTGNTWPLLVGFHGYAETAAAHLDAIGRIPGADRWLVVAVQALHPFYTRDQRVVASWMTRDDREMAIADNIDYVGRVLAAVRTEWAPSPTTVFAGFSQGGAMAYRAAARYEADALIVLAADVPPDVAASTRPLPRVLLGRGTGDEWYTAAKLAADLETLSTRAATTACVFDGGHEWHATFRAAAGELLTALAG
jgi:poly(3-hydroxybutyrate) depolymerase